MRPSGRRANELRAVRMQRNYTKHAEGAVLVEFGDTEKIFTTPSNRRTEDYITGRFG